MFNNILVISASSWFVAQILKTLIHAVKNKKIACERMIGAGG
ncbi:MAG: divergent PAP2 family protein, partial [Oscillospiraceae bacterium]|nr:divergent PAP2 family protein [Oscillospiraceae bacterium]